MESISQFFVASVPRFRYRIALQGQAIGAGDHRMGFTPRVYISVNLIMPSAEEFISSTPNIGVKKLKLK